MKKIGIALLILLGVVFVWKKTNVGSYLCTAWHKVTHSVKEQVPLEFEIDRVRNEIGKLDDDMRGQLGPIAEEMANVNDLRRQIHDKRENLKEEKVRLLTLTRSLEGGSKYVNIGDDEYSADEIRAKLETDFAAYKRCEADLKSQEALLAAKEKSLQAVQKQLASLRSLKGDLTVRLAKLETELKTVRLAQTRDKYQIDDSRLSDIKTSLAEIEHRLDVERSKTELNGQFATGQPIPVRHKVKPTGQLTQEVKNYFGDKPAPKGEKVAAN